jgi:hypothetical protein
MAFENLSDLADPGNLLRRDMAMNRLGQQADYHRFSVLGFQFRIEEPRMNYTFACEFVARIRCRNPCGSALPGCGLCLLRCSFRGAISLDVFLDRFARQPGLRSLQFVADASKRVPGLVFAPEMSNWCLCHVLTIILSCLSVNSNLMWHSVTPAKPLFSSVTV